MSRSPALPPAARLAARVGLLYVSDRSPGIRRLRRGQSFHYLDTRQRRVTNDRTLARIRALAIPPAYESVWICSDERGHIQATGRDARGRKQYRYHADWRAVRDQGKFNRMVAFGAALPQLRRRLTHDLGLPGLPREKVLAAAVLLLDQSGARVGNDSYARDNHSFGITTLREQHVHFARGGRATLRFRGKSGVEHEIVVDNPRLAHVMRRCHELPGQHLFQYLDSGGKRHPIHSGQLNDYLRDTMGDAFTAKDFRTWAATSQAIALLVATALPAPPSDRRLRAATLQIVRQVATTLRNTPSVCRKSYIDPDVFEAWRSGTLHRHFGARSPRDRHVLAFLRKRARQIRSSAA